MKVAILGAGPTGLSAAKYFSRDDTVSVTVIEQANHLGGLQQSFEYDGNHFDVGTILFSQQHGVLEAFPSLRDRMVPIKYKPISITPKGTYDRYPFSPKGFLRANGWSTTLVAALRLLYAKIRFRKKDSVQAFAKYYMGDLIYRKSGLQHYIQRLHDIPDHELDVEFAERRLKLIKRQSLRAMLKSAIGLEKKKTITGARLVRPIEGFPFFYDLIRKELEDNRVDIRLKSNVRSVERTRNGSFKLTTDDAQEEFDRVVSTIPIPTMLELLGTKAKADIQCKHLLSLFYAGRFQQPGNTFFNFSYESKWKRITVFSRYYQADPSNPDWFTVEVTTDDLSMSDLDQVRKDFEQHAMATNLLQSNPRFLGSYATENAYPVYRVGQMNAIEMDKQRIRDEGVDIVGRQGNFEYLISDGLAKKAKKLVENVD